MNVDTPSLRRRPTVDDTIGKYQHVVPGNRIYTPAPPCWEQVALDEAVDMVVVGPEGGISPEEVELFTGAGAKTFHLGRTVLRTSTAGTVATALSLARTGRWS